MIGPSIRPFCTRCCLTMANMTQVCGKFWAEWCDDDPQENLPTRTTCLQSVETRLYQRILRSNRDSECTIDLQIICKRTCPRAPRACQKKGRVMSAVAGDISSGSRKSVLRQRKGLVVFIPRRARRARSHHLSIMSSN